MNHHESKKLQELRVRVSKAGSSLVYFILESNEGLAFYSTLDDSSDDEHRDLIIYTTPEYYAPLISELEHLHKKVLIEILSDREVKDSI